MTDVLFETEEYRVRAAPRSIPVVLGEDEVIWLDGYAVVHRETEQQNGEFRSLADAMLYATKWTQDIEAARYGALQMKQHRETDESLN